MRCCPKNSCPALRRSWITMRSSAPWMRWWSADCEKAVFSLSSENHDGFSRLPPSLHPALRPRLGHKTANHILKGNPAPAADARIFHYDDLLNVRTNCSGLYHNLLPRNARVAAGQVLAEIIDPCTGEILETVYSPADGVVFFRYDDPLIYAYTSAFKILREDE